MNTHAFSICRGVLLILLILAMATAAQAADIVYPGAPLGTDVSGVPNSLFPGNGTNLTNNTVTVTGGSISGNVYGGMANAGQNVSGNQVLLENGTIGGSVRGGYSNGGSVSGNTVTVSGGTVSGDIYGGMATISGNASGNSVLVTGGRAHSLYGGYAPSGDAVNNEVRVSGLTDPDALSSSLIFGGRADGGLAGGNSVAITDSPGLRIASVFGGFTQSDAARNNSITISGSPGLVAGTVTGGLGADGAFGNRVTVTDSAANINSIAGGNSSNGDAVGNSVLILGSALSAGNIFGGFTGGGGNATGNTVGITDSPGFTAVEIYGARAASGEAGGNSVTIADSANFKAQGIIGGMTFFGATAGNNTVTIAGSPNFTVSGPIYGGFANFSPYAAGNTLHLVSSSGAAVEVNGFQTYNFHLPNTLGNGQTLVAITGATPTDLSAAAVNLNGIDGGGKILDPGDSVALIGNAAGLAPFQAYNVPKGIARLYDFDVSTADGSLRATVIGEQRNPATDILPSGWAAGRALLTHYAELLDGLAATRILEPEERRKGPSVYIRSTGGTYQYSDGSDVTVKGASVLAGADWRAGSLTLGAFFEAGFGKYDSRHHFSRLPTVKGDGDIAYYGGGLLGFLSLPAGFYLEGSARGGLVKTDFSSGSMHFIGRDISYDLSNAYYGAHAGAGWLKALGGAATLDLSTKYLWVHQTGDDTKILGDKVTFSASDSHRWRTGARLSCAVSERLTPYVGAAFDYEFDSKAEATAGGLHVPAHSLRGGTGMGEAGLTYQGENGFYLDLGVKGLVGKREGVLGTFMLGCNF
ncbi:putative Outer membrane autotransporter [uncultured delta proteobacterium]|uniref:Putative Outer membrane autotransporter n=1 Tax=uncultured delta proteobacterium TaxID=34034 RepID=A0A212JJG2_9DELT|nr:putative Outer membrane autotransporter [uncultured delta proteobacterium]